MDLNKRVARFLDTKNGEDRTVPLSGRAIEILRSIPRNIGGRVFMGISEQTHKNLWFRALGRAERSYLRECDKSGTVPDAKLFTDLHWHDLRHEATSRLFEKGLGVMEVAAITGHKTLAMLNRYTHLNVATLALKLS